MPLIFYGAGAVLGIFINFEGRKQNPEYPIYVSSGLIHTEFVFDVENTPFDWPNFLPPSSVHESTSQSPRYISLGQGDKRFFYEFFELDDLSLDLAFQGAFLPTTTAIHVEYSDEFNPNLRYYKIMADREHYMKLVDFILKSFRLEEGRPVKIDEFNYFERDAFFWGVESYHLFNTCNMWTARGLSVADLPRPLWAPFRYSIDRALEKYKLR